MKLKEPKSKHIFFIMNSFYYGFIISFTYGVLTSLIVYIFQNYYFERYVKDFFITFNSLILGGLTFGLIYQVYGTQSYVPNIIEKTFGEIEDETYKEHKRRFFSLGRSLRFSATFIMVSFFLYVYAKFPYSGVSEYFMIIYGCALYGCGVYIGRKLFYIAQMLEAIRNLDVKEDIFSEDRLGGITTYVNVLTTLTAIMTWLNVQAYYYGNFKYDVLVGESLKIFMLVPGIIALPVLAIFNFYPRTVLKDLYTKSINLKQQELKKSIEKEELTEFEKIQYLKDMDKISRDELKYRLRVALNDLPMVITILIMILSLFIKS